MGVYPRALGKEAAWSEFPQNRSCPVLRGALIRRGQEWTGQPVGTSVLILVGELLPETGEVAVKRRLQIQGLDRS